MAALEQKAESHLIELFSEYFHLNSARKLLASPPLTMGWSSDSRSALFRHGGDRASSSRRAISTFTVSRPPIAVA